jgi:hypothetical protein
MQLKNNLPPAPVYYIAIQKNFGDLVLATYGRGFYILDDITPIRAWSKAQAKNKNELLAPKQAYRFNYKTGIHTENSLVTGSNPPYGASINYYLADSVKENPQVIILNQKGDTINKIMGTKEKGFNRVYWNLAHTSIELPNLKTIPDQKNYLHLDSAGNRNMFIYDLNIGPGLEPIKVPAGNYTVALKIGAQVQKQNLVVYNDPNLNSNNAAIEAQYALGKQLLSSIHGCLSLIEQMEIKRADLLKINTKESIAKEQTIYNLEKQLFDVHMTGARMDVFRNPARILERLLAITTESQTQGADYAPTTQQKLMYQALSQQLKKLEIAYTQLKL